MSRAPRPGPEALCTDVLSRRVGAAGLCSDSSSDRWFPPRDPRSEKGRREFEALARAACLGCTVMAECRELALRIEAHPRVAAHGVWGGLAPWERDELRRRRREHAARLRAFIAALARSHGLAAAFGEYGGYGPGAWYAAIAAPGGAPVLVYDSRNGSWHDPAGGTLGGGQAEAHLGRAAAQARGHDQAGRVHTHAGGDG